MASSRNQSSWEVSKENIQPLTSGRRMSYLNPSLESSFKTEVNVEQMLRDFDEMYSNYEGDDPLSVWVAIILQLEQHCPSGGKTKYKEFVERCVRHFFTNDKYRNDKRYIDILIKSIASYANDKRLTVLKQCLNNIGIGVTVGKMYLAIADEYEALSNYEAALDIIKQGMEQGAEPLSLLQEKYVQYQWAIAEKVAAKFKEQLGGGGESRAFGSCVPIVGERNEPTSIRTALSPSYPMESRPLPKHELKRVQIFKPDSSDENYQGQQQQRENQNPAEVGQQKVWDDNDNPTRCLDNVRQEKENDLFATKWNQVHQDQLVEKPLVNPRVIQIYEEEEIVSPKRPTPTPRARNQEVLSNVKSGALQEKEEAEDVEKRKEIVPAQVHQNQKIMYRKHQLWRHGKELSFEHFHAEFYRKRTKTSNPNGNKTIRSIINPSYNKAKPEQQQQQEVRKETPSPPLVPKINQDEFAEFRKRLEEMERKLESAEKQKEKFQKKEMDMISEISSIRQVADQLINENDGLKIELDLFKFKIQELENDKEEMNNRLKAQQMKNYASNSNITNNNTNNATNNLPQNPARRLAFTLYESQVESSRCKSFLQDENDGPPPKGIHPNNDIDNSITNFLPSLQLPTLPQTTSTRQLEEEVILDENKENVNIAEDPPYFEKPRRALSGILLPATTAEVQEMIFRVDEENENGEQMQMRMQNNDDNDNDEMEFMVKGGQDHADFNVSNLTRALSFNPRPLGNSTPDRPIDYTSHFRKPSTAHQTPFSSGAAETNYDGEYDTPADFSTRAGPARLYNRSSYSNTNHQQIPQNLSTIQETSKENRTQSTTGSSSGSSRGFSNGSTTFGSNFGPRSVGRSVSGFYQNFQNHQF